MDLEELLSNTKSRFICLVDTHGEIVDFYPKEDDLLEETKDKIIAFSSTVFDMCNHFFKNFLKSNFKNMVMKSDKENIVLVKHGSYVLCLFSNKSINHGVLELSLKKIN